VVVFREWGCRTASDDQSAEAFAPEAYVVRRYLYQGIVLNDRDRAYILSGCDAGVGGVNPNWIKRYLALRQTRGGNSPISSIPTCRRLLQKIPFGVSVTVHSDSIFSGRR
jgi:hypothetical protein